MQEKKVFSQTQALELLAESARFCGVDKEDIALLCTVMQVKMDKFLEVQNRTKDSR